MTRRVGSSEADAWAKKLALRNGRAKSILRAAADYVIDEPIASVSLKTLAEDTDWSVSTVRRQLVWLEEVGAIARLPRWVDASGRPNYEGHGRRIEDDIRFLIEADPMEIAARCSGLAEDEVGGVRLTPPTETPLQAIDGVVENQASEVGGVSLTPPTAENQASGGVSLTGSGGVSLTGANAVGGVNVGVPVVVPPNDVKSLLPERIPTQSPSQPETPQGLAGQEESERKLALFRATYPEASNKPDLVKALWLALDPADWDLLITAAKGARAERDHNPKKALFDQARFIRGGRPLWGEYAGRAPVPSPNVKREFVPANSEAGRALKAMYTITGTSPPSDALGRGFTIEKPLTVQQLAMAQAPDNFFRWPRFSAASRNRAAWREFLVAAIGAGPRIRNFGANETLEKDVFPAPWPWPPRKDGTIYATEEGALLSPEDEDFLKSGGMR
jgi:hypothetical protein